MMNDRDKAKEQLGDEIIPHTEKTLKKGRLKLKNGEYQQYLQQKIAEHDRKILFPYFNTITALVYALEAKDKYISGHSRRVANIAVAIAQELGLPPHRVDKIGIAGLIHDIGKIGVREDVLNKPGKLTDDEYQHVISHCEIGERILRPVVEDEEILDMVRHHHEHYDGTGYPDGLSGKQIPLVDEVSAVTDAYTHVAPNLTEEKTLSQNASILAMADAYDAMTSPRSYRGALSREEAADEIRRGAGTQFDPEVADALLRINDSLISLFEEAEKQAHREAMQLAEERAKREAEEAGKAKEAEKQAKEEAVQLAGEKATGEAEEARKAKEAEKQAKEKAKQLAKEKAKREAEEARKAKEAEKQAKEEAEEIYEGNVYLVLPSPVGFDQFKELLERVENLRILWTGGSTEGTTIGVSVQKPITLLRILNEMPTVEKVNKKDKKIKNIIVVMLKDTTVR